ncbi:hypothetical protein MKY87_01105 [Paenibacillus sp. FSL R7-0198]|uniref:hypothetical protein n=1 Tax=Paenibacillus sp. FSL R7-0198 TaxID=2921674 RepID=UPI0030F80094
METNIGRLIAFVGSVRSGKTKKLIDLYEEMMGDGVKVAVFKPFISSEREGDEFVRSREGDKAPARAVKYLSEIPAIVESERLEAILVDETQLFNQEEDGFIILEGLAMGGLEVYLFGLDVDSENNTFRYIGDILAHADEVHKLRTSCIKCGEEARVSKFVGIVKSDVIPNGEPDDYAPYCRFCYHGWNDRLEELRKTAQITVGGDGFFFTCDIEIERIMEIGYDIETLEDNLRTVDKILEFISKLKKAD